jgi:hypothetical protein
VKNRGICAGSASTSCPRNFPHPSPNNARSPSGTQGRAIVQTQSKPFYINTSFSAVYEQRRFVLRGFSIGGALLHCIFRTFAFFACSWRQAFGPTTRISHLDRPWGSGFSVSCCCWGACKKRTTKQDNPVSPLCLARIATCRMGSVLYSL